MNIQDLTPTTAEHLLRVVYGVPLNEYRGIPIERISLTDDDDGANSNVFGNGIGCDCAACVSQRRTSRTDALNSIAKGDWRHHLRTAIARTRSTEKKLELQRLFGAMNTTTPVEGQWVPAEVAIDVAAVAATIDAVPHVAPLTLAERRTRELIERGINVIPDDECTDMGEYVIWNKYTPDVTLLTRTPSSTVSSYDTLENRRQYHGYADGRDPIIDRKLYAHPTKRVVAVGTWVEREPGMPEEYWSFFAHSVDSNGYQLNLTYTRDGCYNGDTSPLGRRADPCEALPPARWPRGIRLQYGRHLALVLNRDGRIGNARYERAAALLDAYPIGTVLMFQRQPVSTDGYIRARKYAKSLGHMARSGRAADAEAFVALLNDTQLGSISRLMRPVLDRTILAWNDRAVSDDTVYRADCGHYHRAAEQRSVGQDGVRTVCETCFDNDYVYVESRDEYHLQRHCYEDENEEWVYDPPSGGVSDSADDVGGAVVGYSTNVLRTLSPDMSIKPSVYGDTWMGVELEVVPKRGKRRESVKHTVQNLTRGYALLKNDSSLNDGGFEIVTAPRGLAEHIERFSKWTPHPDLRAWDPGCCGLHVHLSSAAFSAATLGKFIEFINATENDALMIAIAGRHPTTDNGARQYCQREGSVPTANPKSTLRFKGTTRYHMVNTCNLSESEGERLDLPYHEANGKNYNTIELRIFRASLNKPRLLAQIEFAHAALMFCRATSMRELRQQHFLAWLQKSAGMYKNLAKWFGVRANTMAVEAAPKARITAEV